MPLYSWCEVGVRQALGCSFDYIEPVSYKQKNTEILQCWVWMWSPNLLPRSKLTTFFPEGAGCSSPGVTVTSPGGDMVELLIHLDRHFDWSPQPHPRTPSSPAMAYLPPARRTRRGGLFCSLGTFCGTLEFWMAACLRARPPDLPLLVEVCRRQHAATTTPTTMAGVTLAATGLSGSTLVGSRLMIFRSGGSWALVIGTAPARLFRRAVNMAGEGHTRWTPAVGAGRAPLHRQPGDAISPAETTEDGSAAARDPRPTLIPMASLHVPRHHGPRWTSGCAA
ncbi:hypothetical protein PAHAL_7G040800 [Panicum hallii]|uniref:Uncharacterized protein n=1 Tax=Panicum hallii TaxID=206008 RepID=A0A2T8IAW8_9POAL|nr:hypothetical protein PAHAL_7G040800 [Panicum hallii]PVH34817.1 hypothetical protein PAHAL_7G040800 [Panicum hallii]PVH34818.1 hypothetical protein PAHAL_7G040800 [Panicum hallii]PVH34819.1 hypothetical protein PAHAL_7G040800 [Panicum hallii]PVH34820.1 hypothetical protein PAHAL_7G040800 [Panicum hallii]